MKENRLEAKSKTYCSWNHCEDMLLGCLAAPSTTLDWGALEACLRDIDATFMGRGQDLNTTRRQDINNRGV